MPWERGVRLLPLLTLGILGAASSAAEPLVLTNCTLEYRRDTLLGASYQGALQELNVGLGDVVAAGQVLGRLQDDDLRAALEIDRVAAESEVAVRKSEAQYTEVLERLRQTEVLRSRNASSTFEQRMMRLEAETARLDVEEARIQRRLAGLRARQTEAQIRLRAVASPHAGVVAEILKEPGELVNIDEPVLRVVDVGRIRVVGRLDVADAWRVRPGHRATLRPDVPGAELPIESEAFAGRVVFVDPQIDPDTQTCRVVAEVANRDGVLRAGISGRLELDLDAPPEPLPPDDPPAPAPAAPAPPAARTPPQEPRP